jgi:hypothetical protein
MKELVFITQSKGGAGKSILAYLFAEKYQDALVVDMDDATKTTTKNLQYRDPLYIKFLNQSNTIDRGAFDEFLEAAAEVDQDVIICDMGASVSEQLPYYLHDNKEILSEILAATGLKLSIFCVVGGGNLFTSTMNYLSQLVKAVDGKFLITVFKNDYYWFNDKQEEEFTKYLSSNELTSYDFTVSKDRNEITQNRVREVLESGNGIKNAKTFSKAYFQMAIKNLPNLVSTESGNGKEEAAHKPQKVKVKQ